MIIVVMLIFNYKLLFRNNNSFWSSSYDKNKYKTENPQGDNPGIFFLFPATFYYLSPVLIVRGSYGGIINGSFIIFTLLFVSAFFLGRAYCGWVCPAGGCQESIFPARDKKVTKGNFIKWIIWIPWIISIVFFAVRSGGYKKIDFLYMTVYGFSVSDTPSLIAYFLVLLIIIVLPAFIFGRRSFCHHICRMAPFLILGRKIRNVFKWPSLQLISDPELCRHCHTCTDHCPMSLPVEEMVNQQKMESTECILCGSCVDECRQNAIKFFLGKR